MMLVKKFIYFLGPGTYEIGGTIGKVPEYLKLKIAENSKEI